MYIIFRSKCVHIHIYGEEKIHHTVLYENCFLFLGKKKKKE